MDSPLPLPVVDEKQPFLVLNMIVKNETGIIDRCLKTFVDLIDAYVICDTGSTDGTPEHIVKFFADASSGRSPAGIVDTSEKHKFVSFRDNRNLALETAEKWCSDHREIVKDRPVYIILCDADMELVVPSGSKNFLASLLSTNLSDLTVYSMQQRTASGTLTYPNARIVRPGRGARYKSITHEYLESPEGHKHAMVASDVAYFIDNADGANRPDKFRRDIRMLEGSLFGRNGFEYETEAGIRTRYKFYLGRSYFDLRDFYSSLKWFKARIEDGGWADEVWYSVYSVALCYDSIRGIKQSERPDEFQSNEALEGLILLYMLRAFELKPTRAEAMGNLAWRFRNSSCNYTAFMFATEGLRRGVYNEADLFSSPIFTAVSLPYEISIAGFYCNEIEAGQKYCEILASGKCVGNYQYPVSEEIQKSCASNLKFYQGRQSETVEIPHATLAAPTGEVKSSTEPQVVSTALARLAAEGQSNDVKSSVEIPSLF